MNFKVGFMAARGELQMKSNFEQMTDKEGNACSQHECS